MHPSALDHRNIEARRRIKEAAAALADALGLPTLEQPTAVEQRQQSIAHMRELEHVATLLEGVCAALIEEAPHGRTKEDRS